MAKLRIIISIFFLTQIPSLFGSCTDIARMAGGTLIGLAVNGAFDFVSTFVHEVGHGIANTALTGNKFAIKMHPAQHKFWFLAPWEGSCTFVRGYDKTKIGRCAVTLSGPLAGVATTYLQLAFLGWLYAKMAHTKQEIVTPFSFLKKLHGQSVEFAQDCKKNKKIPQIRILDSAMTTLMFLRCARIIGETAYGLVPFKIDKEIHGKQGLGDGEKLWKEFCTDPQLPFNADDEVLIGLTFSCMAAPCITGLIKGLRK